MATVSELSDPYANFMLNPLAPETVNVCSVCLTFTQGYDTCYPCGWHDRYADGVLPISYSMHFGQLHHALAGYKRFVSPATQRFRLELAAVLWRFLSAHERCLAKRMDVESFPIVTTVPSSSRQRDESHPLHTVVGKIIDLTRDRYERLLRRSAVGVADRVVDPQKYESVRPLAGEPILLIDDTWTSGANAQSAAGALKHAAAGPVGIVVMGRHVREEHGDNAKVLRGLPTPFDWSTCALE